MFLMDWVERLGTEAVGLGFKAALLFSHLSEFRRPPTLCVRGRFSLQDMLVCSTLYSCSQQVKDRKKVVLVLYWVCLPYCTEVVTPFRFPSPHNPQLVFPSLVRILDDYINLPKVPLLPKHVHI